MSKTIVPKGYKSSLSLYETQSVIGELKRIFEAKLCENLNLKRVSAPLFVENTTGLNDDLNGTERAVEFDIPAAQTNAQVVHSLAKWKRLALYKYDFKAGEGIYTNMNAIRRDEEMDNIHSIYVDQWDWEKVITKADRTIQYLQDTVTAIVDAICDTLEALKQTHPKIDSKLERNVKFITTQELEDMYPDLTSKERENAIVKEYKTVFIMQIGDKLKSGNKHDGRAPDYDDWTLNGDIMFWNETLEQAFEISSMGIRVDAQALKSQLAKAGCEDRMKFMYHQMLVDETLPLTIGGGIGQSRLCMLMLKKAHIGEVQVSVWDAQTRQICKDNNIELL